MGEAALKLDEQQIASQLNEMRAIKAKQSQPAPKRKTGQVLAFSKPKQAASTNEAASDAPADNQENQVIDPPANDASEQQMTERLNADRARASSNRASIGFGPNVERFANNGNLSEQRMAEAEAQVAEMTQKMRAATTIAEAQALRLEYMKLNKELTEEGLENQVDKLKEESRVWIWRLIANGGPAADLCTFGADCGIFTMASDAVVTWQFVYGRALYDNPEPDYLHRFGVPPPTRTKPLKNDPDANNTVKVVMKWWDVMVLILNVICESPLILTMGIVVVIIIYVGAFCLDPTNVVGAAQDSICQAVAGAVTGTGGVAGAVTAAATAQ